jgi:hypothetical protein
MPVRIAGLAEFRRDLAKVDKAHVPILRKGLAKGAEVVVPVARSEAPRRTGALAASLRSGASASARRPRSFVRSALPYARIVHYRRGSANPFIDRAIDRTEDAVLDAVADAIDEVLGLLAGREGI